MKKDKKSQQIMDAQGLQRALVRISHEILERNKDTKKIAIIGIRNRGAYLAQRIVKIMKEIENIELPAGAIDITLHRDDLFTMIKQPVVHKTEIFFDISGRDIILVDDVLFTGRTIRAALDELVDFGRPATIQLAVLVDRGHRELPIRPDYVGKNVPTSLDEVINVRMTEVDKKDEVTIEERER
jgi:pyrimidine operon attenuation protein/uracil phosphoribosyltransferase